LKNWKGELFITLRRHSGFIFNEHSEFCCSVILKSNCEGMKRLLQIEGDRDVYLHTQTWSYKAINIYQKSGFYITTEKGLAGYSNEDYENALLILKDYLRRLNN